MKKKKLNIFLIISFFINFMPVIYSIKKVFYYVPFLQKYGIDMPGETFELALCFGFIALISLFSMFVLIFTFFKTNRAELIYTKDETAAKVAAMKQARQERKENKQREKDERKKAELQRQLDEIDKKNSD
jgi:hypothetical protein|nr:MAG TPA: Selenoprotein S (SelS) [Caudoviricetes sp.]